MIRINLIPIRKGPRKVGIKKDWVVLIFSLVLLLMVLIFVQWKINKEIDDTKMAIDSTKKEIAYYKSLLTEVNKAKEAQKILENKLNVINSLKKQKKSPIRVLDELSVRKPEKLYLESLKKDGAKIGIEGIALDDETVANFMTNLRKSNLFKNVDLIVSERSEQNKFILKKFTLSCEIMM